MSPDKWRVRRRIVPVHREPQLHVPLQVRELVQHLPKLQPPAGVAVWAIWPPQWDIDGEPLLIFPMWPMAFRAAYDRAQFAHAPAPPPREGIDGQA